MMKMYSPSSPTLSDQIGRQRQQQQQQQSPSSFGSTLNHHNHHHHLHHQQHQQHRLAPGSQCLRFKYFATFVISTVCLALLSASLATHKWIVSKPIRVLRLNGGQTNFTALMLTAHGDQYDERPAERSPSVAQSALLSSLLVGFEPTLALETGEGGGGLGSSSSSTGHQQLFSSSQNNKFQGEIYFGLFRGVKVLNYGFGDRVSPISGE